MIRFVLAFFLAFCGTANAQLSGGLQFPGPGTPHSVTVGPPTLVSLGQARSTSGAQTQTITSPYASSAAATRLVIISWTNVGGQVLSGGTITPKIAGSPVGTAISLIITCVNYTDVSTLAQGIAYAVLLSDADTATQLDLSVTFANQPFVATEFTMWTTASTSLVSTTPTGCAHSTAAVTAAPSTSVAASASGFIVAAAMSNQTSANSATITGDAGATFGTTNNDNGFAAAVHSSADTNNNTVTAATHTITSSFANVGSPASSAISAAAWR